MKILYTTDLHGHSWKYKQLIKIFRKPKSKFDVFILGADIFPKHVGDIFEEQKKFITEFLPEFFEAMNVPIIIDMGNDDLECYRELFKSVAYKFDNVYLSHMNEVIIGDVSFIGYHNVPDYPFGLKDHTRRDGRRTKDPFQYGTPVISKDGRFESIPDLDEYLISKKSIEEDLDSLPHPSKNKFVFIAHAPPRGIKLDVCMDYRQVGSWDVTNYILTKKPMVSLHGHIHENFYKTDTFWNELNQTICIQPGQSGGFRSLVYCELDLNDVRKLKRKEL